MEPINIYANFVTHIHQDGQKHKLIVMPEYDANRKTNNKHGVYRLEVGKPFGTAEKVCEICSSKINKHDFLRGLYTSAVIEKE